VEVKIGVQYSPRELVVESTQSPDEVEAALSKALADGSLFSLTDEKGRKVVVPAERISYVEIARAETRKVGFSPS
jgi:hypothetical protein